MPKCDMADAGRVDQRRVVHIDPQGTVAILQISHSDAELQPGLSTNPKSLADSLGCVRGKYLHVGIKGFSTGKTGCTLEQLTDLGHPRLERCLRSQTDR
jgi:hypothetical protein